MRQPGVRVLTDIRRVLAHDSELDEVAQPHVDAIVRLVELLYIGELERKFLQAGRGKRAE